jgi:serine/threonine-protein kinase
VDAAGNTQALPAAPSDYRDPRISPDGARIALEVVDGSGFNVAVYEWAQNRMTKLTFWKSVGASSLPWTPDGKHIAFTLRSSELAGPGIYWIRADGAGEPQRIAAESNALPSSFSPDGKRLAYSYTGAEPGLWTVPLDLADPEHPKAGKPELFLGSKSALSSPEFSPDGRWMAYTSNEGGRLEVFVRPFPGPGGKWLISSAGGSAPHWSRDGRELYYYQGQQMVVPYTVKGDSFAAAQPRPWSAKAPPGAGAGDPAPDGKRFVVVMPSSAATVGDQARVNFLLNFADELRRKVPTGK